MLGELLAFLRQRKEMSLLMLCRQIKRIKIDNNLAIIFSDDDNMVSLMTNEKYHEVVGLFFKEKGLGYKVNENVHIDSPIDVLNKILDGKLIIE